MSVLVLTHAEIERLLPMEECIGVMADALAALARGQVHQPLRMVVQPPEAKGLMALMPAHLAGPHPAYGLKAICLFPENPSHGRDAHQGSVLLFSNETGELLALMNASAITAIRTAAVSAVATRLLAREDASVLALVGAGIQARSHLAAIACVRAVQSARVVSRRIERAKQLAEEMSGAYPFPILPVADVEEAVRGAQIVVTATSSPTPVIKREWIGAGTHLNAVGASRPIHREIDSATVRDSVLYVDRRESALAEAGDYLLALRENAIGPDHIRAELGELLIGTAAGRQSPEQITLFKSLGLAVEDVATADYLYRKAQRIGAGHSVDF